MSSIRIAVQLRLLPLLFLRERYRPMSSVPDRERQTSRKVEDVTSVAAPTIVPSASFQAFSVVTYSPGNTQTSAQFLPLQGLTPGGGGAANFF